MGLPGRGAGSRRGGRRGSELARSLRDAGARSSLPLHRTRRGRRMRGRESEAREVCGGDSAPPGPAWMVSGEWEGPRGAPPWGLGCKGAGESAISPSLPVLFSLLVPGRSLPCTGPLVSLGSLFLPSHYSTTLGNPRGHTLHAPFSASFRAPCSPFTPVSVPSSGKHAPFPWVPRVCGKGFALSSPPFRYSDRLFGPAPAIASSKGAGRCHLGPRPSAPSGRRVLASRAAAPELLPAARAGSRRSRLARPSPAPWEEGRAPGRGSSAPEPALPRPPPSTLRLPLIAAPFPNPVSSSRCPLACYAEDSFRTKLERSSLARCSLPGEVLVNYRLLRPHARVRGA
jgi:hypothetical protein